MIAPEFTWLQIKARRLLCIKCRTVVLTIWTLSPIEDPEEAEVSATKAHRRILVLILDVAGFTWSLRKYSQGGPEMGICYEMC